MADEIERPYTITLSADESVLLEMVLVAEATLSDGPYTAEDVARVKAAGALLKRLQPTFWPEELQGRLTSALLSELDARREENPQQGWATRQYIKSL